MDKKKKKKKKKEAAGTPAWMVTYSDMVTLLLTFFVLLFNISEVNESKLRLVLSSFRGSYSIFKGGSTFEDGELTGMGSTVASLPSDSQGNNLDRAMKAALSELEAEVQSNRVNVRLTKRGLTISLLGDLFFEPGKADLLPNTKRLLDKVNILLQRFKEFGLDHGVEVRGFADGGVIADNSVVYQNNLELSSDRANHVIEYFWAGGIDPVREYQDKIYAKFKSIAYGEYEPLEDNESPETRAYNRRVDIVLLRDPEA